MTERLLEGEALPNRGRPLAVIALLGLAPLGDDPRVRPIVHGIVPPVGRGDVGIERPAVMGTSEGIRIAWPRPFSHPDSLLSAPPGGQGGRGGGPGRAAPPAGAYFGGS